MNYIYDLEQYVRTIEPLRRDQALPYPPLSCVPPRLSRVGRHVCDRGCLCVDVCLCARFWGCGPGLWHSTKAIPHAMRYQQYALAAWPVGEVILTGHSLGGGLAKLVSAKLRVWSVTFSSPGVFATSFFQTSELINPLCTAGLAVPWPFPSAGFGPACIRKTWHIVCFIMSVPCDHLVFFFFSVYSLGLSPHELLKLLCGNRLQSPASHTHRLRHPGIVWARVAEDSNIRLDDVDTYTMTVVPRGDFLAGVDRQGGQVVYIDCPKSVRGRPGHVGALSLLSVAGRG